MTNGERVAYSHGRVKDSMNDIREAMGDLHHGIDTAYRAWLTVLILGLATLIITAIPLWSFPHWQWYKLAYPGIAIYVFLVARLVSFHKIKAVKKLVRLCDRVVHDLSNTQTLQFGFEDIRQENIERKKREQNDAQ